jgi:hypothetical protein
MVEIVKDRPSTTCDSSERCCLPKVQPCLGVQVLALRLLRQLAGGDKPTPVILYIISLHRSESGTKQDLDMGIALSERVGVYDDPP